MGEPTEQSEQSSVDALFDALTAGAEERPESRVLDALVGRWRTRTEWEPIVGQGVRHIEGITESAWIYDGRVLHARSTDAAGVEVGAVLFAYDGLHGDYVAFAFNRLSTFFAVERGRYLPESRSFELEVIEPRRDGGPGVRVRRTIRLIDVDRYTTEVSYPDVAPGTFGPMFVTHERIA
jgi:hypothetical protein